MTIIACGHMVWKSIEATKVLKEKGISVDLINMHTIKPLDKEAILNSIQMQPTTTMIVEIMDI